MKKESESEKKIYFGGYAIIEGARYTFEKMPELWWDIEPITSGMELARSKFLYHNRVIEGLDGSRYEQPPSPMEIAYREIALTFGGTSMQFEDGTEVLPKNANVFQIEAVLAQLPQEMVMELWREVGRLFPKWGPVDPNG